ncbi:hypothetical protein VE00_09562 [Pseudogymnoascus sp. WSF 3629]|nr:hypothetical protein VE00_09562 [Pseudogymnoascus sp. WSF 3629]
MASSIALRLANEATASQAVAAARMAKYAHQPPNTRRMYVGYQKEWEAWCNRYGWEDDSLVREAKLVLWLQEDVLQRRHAPRTRKRKVTPSTASISGPSSDADTKEALATEAKELAKNLETPLEEALAMLIDDRIAPQTPGGGEEDPIKGALLQYTTIEV